jgi:hypothetical protein
MLSPKVAACMARTAIDALEDEARLRDGRRAGCWHKRTLTTTPSALNDDGAPDDRRGLPCDIGSPCRLVQWQSARLKELQDNPPIV